MKPHNPIYCCIMLTVFMHTLHFLKKNEWANDSIYGSFLLYPNYSEDRRGFLLASIVGITLPSRCVKACVQVVDSCICFHYHFFFLVS